MKIGIFDSGIGGVTVLKNAVDVYPYAHYIYFADTDNVPYGTKKKKKIKSLVTEAAEFLVEELKVDLLVIACNTATSVCIKDLRSRFSVPIIGMEPAVKPAAIATRKKNNQNRILVSATRTTLKQKKLKSLINNLNASDKVDLLSLQKLVKFAEKNDFDSKKVVNYLERKFSKFDLNQCGALVLGCTHFIYYKELIRSILPSHIELIDGNQGTVNRMLYFIKEKKLRKNKKLKLSYYVSKRKASVKKLKVFLEL